MKFATDQRPADEASTQITVDEFADQLGHRPTLLAVWAHPDDESYLGGGLMAAVAAKGGRVISATATLGEHGTDDPERFPPSRLREVRRAELGTALRHLGADGPQWIGFADGECDRVGTVFGARCVGRLIDRFRPDLVLSFGPDGVTGHADHRAVAAWTATAVARRGDHLPLLATAATAAWSPDLIERMHRVDAFYPGFPCLKESHSVVRMRVGGAIDRKLRALEAHASQIGPLQAELGADGYRRLAEVEAYRPLNASAAVLTADLVARPEVPVPAAA
jgi:LmbE family N-acetylglucosaminyl deacetylase